MLPVRSFEDLRVWQRAADLTVASYAVARRLPDTERFELGKQLRRAAASVPANIAEGNGRAHRGAYLYHLSVAMGSLKELESHVLISVRLGLLHESDVREVLALCDQVGRLLTNLSRSLRRQPTVGRERVARRGAPPLPIPDSRLPSRW